jgi:hypothetical protein
MRVCLLIAILVICLREHFQNYLAAIIKTWQKMMTLKLVYSKKPKNIALTELMESSGNQIQ